MIITLKGADFSASNIGTLSSWRITRSLGAGATYEGALSVEKGSSFGATVTIAEGYELGSAGVTVTMGGNAISVATVNGNTITISIAEVTGNVVIKVPTVNINTGEEEEPDVDNYIYPYALGCTLEDNKALSTSGAQYRNTKEGAYTFSNVPVQPDTFYYVPEGTRVWFIDTNKTEEGISTIHLINESVIAGTTGYFVTPSDAAYIHVSTWYDQVSPENFVIVPVTSNDFELQSTVNIAGSGATFHDNSKLESNNGYMVEDTTNNSIVYQKIPATEKTVYCANGATRVAYLASNGARLGTRNIVKSGVPEQFWFVTPADTAEIWLGFNRTNIDKPVDQLVLSSYIVSQSTV